MLGAVGLIETDRYRCWTYYRLRPGALVRLTATLGLFARSSPSGTACRRLIPGAEASRRLPGHLPAKEGLPCQPASSTRPGAPPSPDRCPCRDADVVVTMGCGDACPIYSGKRYLDWELDDPAGKPVEQVRAIRDEIDARVQQLLTELVPASA